MTQYGLQVLYPTSMAPYGVKLYPFLWLHTTYCCCVVLATYNHSYDPIQRVVIVAYSPAQVGTHGRRNLDPPSPEWDPSAMKRYVLVKRCAFQVEDFIEAYLITRIFGSVVCLVIHTSPSSGSLLCLLASIPLPAVRYVCLWLTDSLTHSLTHSLKQKVTDWLKHKLTDWLTDWLKHKVTDWLTD